MIFAHIILSTGLLIDAIEAHTDDARDLPVTKVIAEM
jgi:hypothetical protein